MVLEIMTLAIICAELIPWIKFTRVDQARWMFLKFLTTAVVVAAFGFAAEVLEISNPAMVDKGKQSPAGFARPRMKLSALNCACTSDTGMGGCWWEGWRGAGASGTGGASSSVVAAARGAVRSVVAISSRI